MRSGASSSSSHPPISGASASGFPTANHPASGLNAFEREVVAVFADLVVLLGLPKSMGEIYGYIFASAESPTFADIEHKLGLSKGSVSQGLRSLRELGAVSEAGSEELAAKGGVQGAEPGAERPNETPSSSSHSRATRWVATTELRQLIGTLLRERLTPYLGRQDQRMQAAEVALHAQAGDLAPAHYKTLEQRLSKLQTWQSRARTVLPVIGKML